MAKGVKKIKWVGSGGVLGNHSLEDTILCIRPNEEAPFVVGEWYNETPEEDKRRDITWLWMDQKRRTIFKRTIKPAGVPYGVKLPKKLCGNYAFYLEASLYGGHDHRKTGLHVYGKCDEKIISSSWSKKENAIDHSVVNYGDDLFIKLEAEGINGNSLTVQLYSARKTDKPLETVRTKCVDGRIKATFKTMSCYWRFPGLPDDVENFYIKVIDIKEDYIKNASGSDKILSFNIIKTDSIITIPVFEIPTNTAPLTIDTTPVEEVVKTEGIIMAYFAKEEFTKETTEVDGKHEYKFANANIKYDKNKIAGIIKSKVDALVKADKKYAKLDDIKNALAEESYAKDATIIFNLCKLGAEYKKINSAPLEGEVYVIAKTFLLDGKEVTITIKEKEAIVVETDAAVPILEAKENGEELTILNATVENGIAKVKIKLRPKADEALATWKEKLAGNKKDDTYNYSVKNAFTVNGDLDAIAASIEKKSNAALAPNHIVKKDDIKSLLNEGVSYTTSNSFQIPKYKKGKTTEMLWLKAECQGETVKHEGEFLKRDGEYFVIGKQCECEERVRAFMRMLRVKEGTEGEKGYTMLFAKKDFIKDYGKNTTKHPEVVVSSANGYSSSAAGAYQIMADTYNDKGFAKNRNKYNINSFDQESQDKLCVTILKHNYVDDRPSSFYNPIYWKDVNKTERDTEKENKAKEKRKKFKGQNGDIIKMLINNNYEKALLLSSLCWASLPDSPYGQPVGTKEECKSNYEKFLEEELEGKSDLYIKKDFLKDFGYDCCGNNSGSAKWQNPLKNNQITIYTFGGSKRPWRSAFGRVRTDMTGTDNGARPHHGLDLFANIGTEVYACLPGEVVSLTPGTGYGNGFVFKIDAGYLEEFKKQRRSDYSPYYVKSKRTYDSQKYDITGYGDFEEYEGISESTDVYLMYAHLSEVLVDLNERITESNMEKILGKTGTSGATNTKGPHLHFEIRSKQNPSGYAERYNPAFYIDYKTENQLTDAEREIQDTVAGK